ncbi:hypothetical protein V7S43_015480 [Phytophthora oleae]|uniref:PiggyBac transposable element-derived protein domain-containing protein n=1 Tax=Phytophthora oleae TaxID=2107226 RepID=A0ABD3EZI9_9STRA
MEAATKPARIEQHEQDPFEDSIKTQGFVLRLVACIDPKTWTLSGVMPIIYAVKAKTRKRFEDRK